VEKLQFTQLPLSNAVNKAIADMGFEEPTFIQAQSIPLALEGKDIVGLSQTGTGKTAAFGIPLVERVDPEQRHTQALVLCPTRELAVQACEEMRKLAKYKQGIKIVPIYGGQPIDRQIKLLKTGTQIVIGTPGRIMDHLKRRTLKLESLSTVVLDEADEMLNMGFRDDIEKILEDVPEQRQTILFSATMPPAILRITKKYQNNPSTVKMEQRALTVPTIAQYSYEVPRGQKVEMLARLLDYNNPSRSIVFCNTKSMVDKLVEELKNRGFSPGGLHGDMNQQARMRMLKSFKTDKIDILIATDVAARGIDVDDVEAVFNFDIPQGAEFYVHRIGRTGRAGKSGSAHTLVVGRQQIYALKDIERYTKSKIELKPIPTRGEVQEVRSERLIKKIATTLEGNEYRKQIALVDELMERGFTSVDVACAALQMLSESLEGAGTDDRQADESEAGRKKKKSATSSSKRKDASGTGRKRGSAASKKAGSKNSVKKKPSATKAKDKNSKRSERARKRTRSRIQGVNR
jgi:ATP-dependent RNA helicase DeaD